MLIIILVVPRSAPLISMFMIGNMFRESGVVPRLATTASNELINIATIFLMLTVGAQLTAQRVFNLESILILVLGLIAFLIPITLFFSGVNILIYKRQIVFIDNLFFCIIYIILGSLFLSYFKNESFLLTVNGNGGFIGLFLEDSFLASILEINKKVSYYVLAFIIFFID